MKKKNEKKWREVFLQNMKYLVVCWSKGHSLENNHYIRLGLVKSNFTN
jgi:hypothetical protein